MQWPGESLGWRQEQPRLEQKLREAEETSQGRDSLVETRVKGGSCES